MLLKDGDITVYQIDNTTFAPIGILNQCESIVFRDALWGYSDFEIWAPITEDNTRLLQLFNVIYYGGVRAGIIEVIQSIYNESGLLQYYVKGRTLESLLTRRTINKTMYVDNQNLTNQVLPDLINNNFITPSDTKRMMPWISTSTSSPVQKMVSFQATGKEVYDIIVTLCLESGIDFNMLFNPVSKQINFSTKQLYDRSINQNINPVVMFDTDLSDLLSSRYYDDAEKYKTEAYIAGEGEEFDRYNTVGGDLTLTGYNKFEYYIDARDLQHKITDQGGVERTLTDTEYEAVLQTRLTEKLAERIRYQNYECELNVYGNNNYTYGVDYFKGDTVTIRDGVLGVTVSAQITEVEESLSNGIYQLILMLGFQAPTIMQTIKQMQI